MTLAAEMIDQNRIHAADLRGMVVSEWARLRPDKRAAEDSAGRFWNFRELNSVINRMVRLLRLRGLKTGDHVAMVCSNRVEFVAIVEAALRGGFRVVPVNWHLAPDEIAYIIKNSEAKAVFWEVGIPDPGQVDGLGLLKARLAIGGDIDGFENLDAALSLQDNSDVEPAELGNIMFYTSGTTGRPKGVYRHTMQIEDVDFYDSRGYDEASVHMCAGPAYHGGPMLADVRGAMRSGATLILMGKWDSEATLRTIAEKRVTHLHMVPTMLQRMLALPPEIRARYEISHVRALLHGAAPCPPEVKRDIIEWFGSSVIEYYAGSEGGNSFLISADEWLRKPGSVGRRPDEEATRILDEAGADCGPGEIGAIYMKLKPTSAFHYYKDNEKTNASRDGEYFTLGDMGYVDEEGYLFLTGRSADTIISGGVNIYPQEIDNILIEHPKVAAVATVGVPDVEWGESVKSVVVPTDLGLAGEALAAELLEYAGTRLPKFKVPRGIDFTDTLPTTSTGKILRRDVRAPYWAGRKVTI